MRSHCAAWVLLSGFPYASHMASLMVALGIPPETGFFDGELITMPCNIQLSSGMTVALPDPDSRALQPAASDGTAQRSPSVPAGRHCVPSEGADLSDNFHGFLEVAPDAVAIIDRAGGIVQFNGQAERLFGYSRQEVMNQCIEMLMPLRFRTGHLAHRLAYASDMRPRSMGSGLNLLGARKDGSEFPIDVMLSPLHTKAGVFIACAVHDMTVHRTLENALRQKTREVEALNQQKDNFVAMVMHELRGPLSVLTNVCDLLKMPALPAAGKQNAIVVLERQTVHMIRLVNDLLDVSKARGGQLQIRAEVFDLRTIVVKAVEISQAYVDLGKHTLCTVQSSEPLHVSGDPVRLIQVLANLVTNAAKYTARGGRITIWTARQSGCAVLCVEDNGDGIAADMLHQVFDLFTQVALPGAREADGMGIGLALVQRLVQLHSGTVSAASQGRGQGSQFTVSLPLVPHGPQ